MSARILTILLSGFGLFAAAIGSPLNYAQRAVSIRAGVVLIDSQQTVGQASNYNPYVWFNLDSNRAVKPGGWNFYNPLSAGTVTAGIQTRWTALNAALGSGIVPVLGQQLTKRDAPYWEVRLSALSDVQLSQFDVLHLSAYGFVSMNPTERERLRRFMEHGGMLWVDLGFTAALNLDAINGFPLPFTVSTAVLGTPFDVDATHPLLSFPAGVTADNLLAMQAETTLGWRTVDLAALGVPALRPILSPLEADCFKFHHVAQDTRGPFVSVGAVGDGFMVVTTRAVGTAINRTQRLVGRELPSGVYVANNLSVAEQPLFDRTSDAAAKLVVNMVHLTSGFGQSAKGSRKTTSGPIDIGAPLLKRFNSPLPLNPGPTNYASPAVYKGLVAISSADRVFVYDIDPNFDLNGDGDPDDGVADFSLGATFDLVWVSQSLAGPISAPTAVEVPNGTVRNQISVVDYTGSLQVFEAFPAVPTGNMAPAASIPNPGPATFSPVNLGDPGRGPYSATFHDGLYFVTDEVTVGLAGVVGRVWIADAATAAVVSTSSTWAVCGAGVTSVQRPSASPTVGYIPILDNSGGVDRVIYLPTRASPIGGPANTAGVTSLWVGAKGERPSSFQQVGSILQVVTRASLSGLDIHTPGGADPLGVRLTLIDSVGNPLNAAAMNTLFTGAVTGSGGILRFTMQPAQVLPANVSVRVDYTIDWGTGVPAIQNQIIRGQLFMPDDLNRRRMIVDQVALSPEGTMHLVSADPSDTTNPQGHDGGTYFAFREEGRGSFRLLSRYDLYPSHRINLNQANPTTYAETLFDTDELITLAPPFLAGSFQRLRFRSGPVVHNGIAYLSATGTKNVFVPCSIILAFQAEPSEAEIRVPDITGGFTLLQPDLARSDNKTQPTVYSVLQPNQFVHERNSGGGFGTIRLSNLMPTTRGPVVNAFSRSQPVIVRRSGQPDLFIEPDRNGSRWSPMLWYTVYHGYDNRSPLLATGNTLFMASNSRLPDIVNGVPFPSWQNRGLLTAMNADVSPSDPFLRSNPTRPWLKQLWQIQTTPTFRTNPDFRWPQFAGNATFDDWRIRLNQTVLGASTEGFGIVGGDGVAVAWSELGLWTFARADFLVADEGRLARFDSSGNPIWSSDSSTGTGQDLDSGGAGNVNPLVRPTRAYSINAREMVVVDTGADAIKWIDVSGRVRRSLTKFRLDPNYTPDGFESSDLLTLRQPRDVFVYTYYVPNPAQYSNAQPLEFWVRYVVADAGNNRLLEIIDRYAADPITRRIQGLITDGSGQSALGILNWHTPASLKGNRYAYNSLAAVYDSLTGPGRWRIAASIGSALPTRTAVGLDTPTTTTPTQSEEGNGGIVFLSASGQIEEVINEVDVPAIGAGVFFNPATGLFDSTAAQPRTKKLGNIRAVTTRFVVDPTYGPVLAVMFTDSDGVFEVIKPGLATRWFVRWMIPRAAYKYVRRSTVTNLPLDGNPRDLFATYARRLDSGEVLIVNGYAGRTLGPIGSPAEFNGEIVQVGGELDGTGLSPEGFNFNKQNLGFNSLAVKFELPPVVGARSILLPVFADRR